MASIIYDNIFLWLYKQSSLHRINVLFDILLDITNKQRYCTILSKPDTLGCFLYIPKSIKAFSRHMLLYATSQIVAKTYICNIIII